MNLIQHLKTRTNAMTVTEVADFLKLSSDTVYRMAAESEIASFRARGSVRFDPGDIIEWLTKQKPQPVKAAAKQFKRA